MGYIFGRNPVIEALKAGRTINKILVAKGSLGGSVSEIAALARENNVPLQHADKKQLDYLAGGGVHQGVAAQIAAWEYADWEEELERVNREGDAPLFLLLDGVEDPQNLGAVLRTADAAGVHCVIIPKNRAVPLTSGVARASAGAIEHVPVSRVTNLARTIDALKDKGCWITGADPSSRQTLFETNLAGPLALVVGGENRGLSRLLKEKCDTLVRIPMNGRVNSLNVSAAAAVLLYEIVRQRGRR
ncbi:MAG: 23S rRNA (guanosine(2251)-2'-O)-methyltransferase RlmB [Peptococcaceae bacterium]|jgi:23S rRNA (guanosine2251-2'-O)-methyltransferase|nr:23S rRNA (guanosine(2251)-2'-O)-methyltransferase RlmB [Peptococcaceae bacterium]MDH7526117.1 23S rRNA (guanosine(2251)-2'-O)-methyltransferase RlmB [Peptococcaceae bacterium]